MLTMVCLAAFLVALAHALLLGLPYVLLLLIARRFGMLSMLSGGLVIGFIPAAFLVWPHVQSAAITGLLGAAGSATFYLSYRRLSPVAGARQ
jgi:hypothetical protein